MVSFISCVVIQHPWNGPFWEVFGRLLPQIWSNFAEVFSRGSTLPEKNVWRIFFGKGTDPKFGLMQLWSSCFPWQWPKSKKIYTYIYLYIYVYILIKALSPLLFLLKIRLLFALFELFWAGNRAGGKGKGSESKLDISYFIKKNFNPDFQVRLLSLIPRLHFWKKIGLPDAEFIVESDWH